MALHVADIYHALTKIVFGAAPEGAGKPTITFGAGLPGAAEPDGSLYLLSTGALFVMAGGVWTVVWTQGTLPVLRGTSTLGVGGNVTIAATITANSRIFVSVVDFAGTPGLLSVPVAQRNVGAATFQVQSLNVLDRSTIDWLVID